MGMDNCGVIIPAYNEAERIGAVLEETKKFCKNIVVVDDGSRDETFEVASKYNCTVLRHLINLGKGNAAKTGCDYAVKHGAKVLILMDSDGQHRPADIPRFLKALEGRDIVFGYRTLSKNMPFLFRLGNFGLNTISEFFTGLKLKDTQSGYRAMTSETYKKVRWVSSDYAMESEMIANASKHKLRYAQIPIDTIYSDSYKGTTVLDGLRIGFKMGLMRLGIK